MTEEERQVLRDRLREARKNIGSSVDKPETQDEIDFDYGAED
jgi:hypothetical protein